MRAGRRATTGILLSLLLLIGGCGGEPYTYVPENELKPGPGLFSGEDGEFNLINAPDEGKEEESGAQPSSE